MRQILKTALAAACATAIIGSAGAADPGVKDNEIVVGAFLPLQSGLAAGATQVKDGAESYFKYINDKGGVHGRKITWITENDSYNPQQAVAVARKLIDRDQVFAIVSTLGTSTALAVLPLLAQRNIPAINLIGGDEKLNAPKEKHVFGLLPTGEENGKGLGRYAVQTFKTKKPGIFFQNDKFGTDIRDGARSALKDAGLSTTEGSYVPSASSVAAQVVSLREAGVDTVVMACITKHGALFLQEAQKLGWKPNFIALNTMGDPITADLAGGSLEGVVINLFVAVDTMNHPKVKEANEILAKYAPKTKPGYWSYMGMAGAMAFVEASNKAGKDLTRAKLVAALESMNGYSPGVVPPLPWSKTNHGSSNLQGYAIWKGGKLEVLKGW